MRLILIYLSVIMLLGYVACSEVHDLFYWCMKGRSFNFNLTYGVGLSDILILMFSSQKSLDCILNLNVEAKHYIMTVLEFPYMNSEKKICVSRKVSGSSVTVSEYNEAKKCQFTGLEPTYRSLSFEKTTVQLKNDLNTIKIIATSMRGTKDFDCFTSNETECMVAKKIYCMTKQTACDGHPNCGIPYFYDEDKSNCIGKSLSPFVVISSFIMAIFTIFLFGTFCLTLFPDRKETFVYKTDDITIFDTEGVITNTEIDIQILFNE